ncbi:MAG: AsmA family protein [Gammaproteobacteria bacterium]
MGKVIKILAGLFIAVIIVVAIVISTFDVNEYKGEITQAVEDATGRKLDIGGDIGFKVSLIPTVVIEDIKFANASWGSKPDMLSLGKFEVQVSLMPLLSGNIQVNRVILLAPEILLETNKKGMGNWVLDSKQTVDKVTAPSESSTPLPAIVVSEVHIENASITYKDGVTGKETKVVIENIETKSDSFDDPLSLLVKVAYNEIPIKIEGSLGSVNQLKANENYPVDLKIDTSDAIIGLHGQVAKPMEGKGLDLALSFNVASLSKLSKLAETKLPALGPISLSGKLLDGKDSYSIKSLKLQAGKTDLSGELTVNLAGKRPALTAKLNSNNIDLVELSGGEAAAKKEVKKERVFSPDPLPLEGLKSVNANVTINAKQIKTNSLVLKKTKIVLTLKNGNLSIKPLSTLVAGGAMNANIGLNASGKTAMLVTDINIKGLELSQLEYYKGRIKGGKTDVTIKIKGSGNSVSKIMAGLNGKLLAKIGKGELKDSKTKAVGMDLFSLLNPTAASRKGTLIECGVINFKIKDGIATADKGIAFAANTMNVIGSGTIDLKTEKLDIGITPQAREGAGISVGQLAELVRIKGTLANPKPGVDSMAALKAGAGAAAAVATGGLSILAQGLYDRSSADEDPCATALGQKPAKTTTASEEPEKSTTTKAVDTVKDAGSAVSDTIKGWFK